MAAEKGPQKAGHPEVRGSRKEEQGMGNTVAQRSASPSTEKSRCPGGFPPARQWANPSLPMVPPLPPFVLSDAPW